MSPVEVVRGCIFVDIINGKIVVFSSVIAGSRVELCVVDVWREDQRILEFAGVEWS